MATHSACEYRLLTRAFFRRPRISSIKFSHQNSGVCFKRRNWIIRRCTESLSASEWRLPMNFHDAKRARRRKNRCQPNAANWTQAEGGTPNGIISIDFYLGECERRRRTKAAIRIAFRSLLYVPLARRTHAQITFTSFPCAKASTSNSFHVHFLSGRRVALAFFFQK